MLTAAAVVLVSEYIAILFQPRSNAKFENPDQFRPIDTDNGTRPDLLFVGIQEQRILGDVLITGPCCKTLTRQQANSQGWAAKRGEDSKVTKYGAPASQGGYVFLPFVFET